MYPKSRTIALDVLKFKAMWTCKQFHQLLLGIRSTAKSQEKTKAPGPAGLFEEQETCLSKGFNKLSCYTWITDDIKELLLIISLTFSNTHGHWLNIQHEKFDEKDKGLNQLCFKTHLNFYKSIRLQASLTAQQVKNPPAVQETLETPVRSLA